MKALHFGAGNIGRGFIGLLLFQSGYEVVFADVAEALVDKINESRAYRVITLGERSVTERVEEVRAVHLNSPECVNEIVDADMITTAVGVRNLPGVAQIVLSGIRIRAEQGIEKPLTIMACENGQYATDMLRQAVSDIADDEILSFIDEHVQFVNVTVDRIVPNVKNLDVQPLDVVVEEFYEWDIDRSGLKHDISVQGATMVDSLGPYLDRKLFLLNGIHAIVAYLGYLQGYRTIDEAIADERILNIARTAQEEVISGLRHKYPSLTSEELASYARKIITRFQNKYLQDEVTRVGRDPVRKVSLNERLVSPLLLALAAGNTPHALMQGIAAAYCFDYPNDEQACALQNTIREKGIIRAIEELSSIDNNDVVEAIARAYEELRASRNQLGSSDK
jgi:mannitol-1-phosphate 5-dehydrogenase